MCSISEEDLIPYEENVSLSPGEKCKKCENHGEIIIRKRDIYCINCFTLTTNHKFRATLGKSKLIRANEKVLISVSGGIASMVLLEFVRFGINAEAHKKLRINPFCIHIDESIIDPHSLNSNEFILNQCKEAGIPCYVVPLSTYFCDHLNLEPDTLQSTTQREEEKVRELFDSLSSETSRIEMKIRLRTSLIVKLANHLKCNFILTGESCTKLAATMLSDVSLGRGAQLESEVGFIDNRYSTIKLLRPMRDITYEELIHMTNIKNIQFLKPTGNTNKASLQGLIEKFVNDLQVDFPATISTICRTGEKLCDEESPKDGCCVICQSNLDTQDRTSSALQATEFSRLVSNGSLKPNGQPPSIPCNDCTCSKKGEVTNEVIEQHLCYGCRLILRDNKSDRPPNFIVEAVRSKMALESLRSEINDFLL